MEYILLFFKFSGGDYYLCLIGFKERHEVVSGNKTIDLYYDDSVKNIGIEGIIQSFGIKNFKDIYLKFDNVIHDYKSLCCFEIFGIVININILEKGFSKYKSFIEQKMKNECKGI